MKLFSCLLALFGVAFGQNYCDDAYECDGVTVSTTYMYCYGYFACDEADITSTYGYYYGYYSNYYGDINTYYTYAYGAYSLLYADVLARYIYAYGFYSAYLADISPRTSYLYAYFYGYYAGYYADISCYSGDYCYLYCGTGMGCYITKYYCYSQAQCYYHCDNADYCPTLYSGTGSTVTFEGETKGETFDGLTDEQIKAKHTENKKIKKEHFEKESNKALEGEDEAATKARTGLLAIDGHSPSIINGASFDNSLVIGGAAVSVAFVFGLLFGKYVKPSEEEKPLL